MITRRLVILLLLALAPATASEAFFFRGGKGTGVATQTISSVSVSPLSYINGSPDGTVVGTISVSTSGLSFVGTGGSPLTISDTTHFKIVGNQIQLNGTQSGTRTGVTVTATDTHFTNSPFTSDPFTITGNTPGGELSQEFTISNPATGSSLPASWFTVVGLPIEKGTVSSSQVLTGTLGGSSVRVCNDQLAGPKLESDGSAAWQKLIIDASGVAISPGNVKSLVFTPTAGSWSQTTSRTNADWTALVDIVQLTGMTTSGTAATDMASANTWTAKFDGTTQNTIEVVGSSPCGLEVFVTANFVDQTTSVTHAYLQAQMNYLVTQKGDGSLGPVASRGPFVVNTQVIKKTAANVNNPSLFTFNLAYKRSGSTIRSETGVACPAFTMGCGYPRTDGKWDWDANDPGTDQWVSDYTTLRRTKKIAPLGTMTGYTGQLSYAYPSTPIASISGTTGLLSHTDSGATYNLWNGNSTASGRAIAVDVIGTSLPTSLVADTVYWLKQYSGSTSAVFDTLAHALAAGSTKPTSCPAYTGQICPGTSYSVDFGLRHTIAPTNTAQYRLGMTDTGARPDLSLYSEWGTAFILAGSSTDPVNFNRLGRVMANSIATTPSYVINHVVGPDGYQHPVCLLDVAGCPAGLIGSGQTGSSFTTTWWLDGPGSGKCSSNIGGGTCGTGGPGGWGLNRAHWPEAVYPIWLLTGDEFLRRLILARGNHAISYELLPARNQTVATGTCESGSTICYGVGTALMPGSNFRRQSWEMRDLTMAAFAANEGSPEQTYFRKDLTNNMEAHEWYANYNGSNYRDLGVPIYIDNQPKSSTVSTGSLQVVHQFMQIYTGVAYGASALLQGDFISGTSPNGTAYSLNTMADRTESYVVGLYTQNCPYMATQYSVGVARTDRGGSSPATWISGITNLGHNNLWQTTTGDLKFNFATDGSITVQGPYSTPPFQAWYPVAGDQVWFANYFSGSLGAANAAPSPFVDGTVYTITDFNSTTGVLHVSGVVGTPASPVTGVGGFFVPTAQDCGSFSTTDTLWGVYGPDVEVPHHIGGLGVAAVRGVSGATTGFPLATQIMGAHNPNWYKSVAHFYFGPDL